MLTVFFTNDSGLFFDFLGDFVSEFLKFALLKLHAFAFKILDDVATSLFALFGSKEKTNCCAGKQITRCFTAPRFPQGPAEW